MRQILRTTPPNRLENTILCTRWDWIKLRSGTTKSKFKSKRRTNLTSKRTRTSKIWYFRFCRILMWNSTICRGRTKRSKRHGVNTLGSLKSIKMTIFMSCRRMTRLLTTWTSQTLTILISIFCICFSKIKTRLTSSWAEKNRNLMTLTLKKKVRVMTILTKYLKQARRWLRKRTMIALTSWW